MPAARFEEHSNFVNAVACLPPCGDYPDGLVVTGSLDRTAVVWEPVTAQPLTHLIGHENAVYVLPPARPPAPLPASPSPAANCAPPPIVPRP